MTTSPANGTTASQIQRVYLLITLLTTLVNSHRTHSSGSETR